MKLDHYITNSRLVGLFGWLATFCGLLVYSRATGSGLTAAFGDSWIYTDMAKRLGILGTLRMDRVFDLVYPPLYSVLISPAYALSSSNAHIFLAVRIINMAVYSVTFFPIFQLFRRYCRWPVRSSFFGALLLSFSPCTLHYTRWILAEPLYIPLVALTFYCVFEEKHFGSPPENVAFGLVLAALPSTKAIGNIVVIAFAVLAAGQLIGIVESNNVKRGKWKPLGLTIAVCVGALLIEKFWLAALLPRQHFSSYGDQLSDPILREARYWFDRTTPIIGYLLISPGTVAALFMVCLTLFRSKIVLSDKLLLMTFLCWIGSMIVIPLFTAGDPKNVYHGRYLMPFAFLPTIISAKYLDDFDRKSFLVIAALLMAMFLVGWPAGLQPFASAYRDGILYIPGMTAFATNAIYLSIMLLSSWFLCNNKPFGLKVIAALLVLIALWGSHTQNTDTGSVPSFESYDCDHLGADIIQRLSADPTLKLYVDDKWRNSGTWVQSERIMFMVLAVPNYVNLAKIEGIKKGLLLAAQSKAAGAVLLRQGKKLTLFEFR